MSGISGLTIARSSLSALAAQPELIRVQTNEEPSIIPTHLEVRLTNALGAHRECKWDFLDRVNATAHQYLKKQFKTCCLERDTFDAIAAHHKQSGHWVTGPEPCILKRQSRPYGSERQKFSNRIPFAQIPPSRIPAPDG